MKKENQSQPAEEVQEKDNRRSNRSMGILTVDASGVLAERDTGDTAWHELVNAYRTKKILSGDLGGI
ncbi:MAG: RNA-binding protein, partial [Hungatella sp.]